VGHIARLLEDGGIATVVVAARAFQPRLQAMRVPRMVTTPFLMGRPLGLPGDTQGQRAIVQAALTLLETATHNGTLLEFP
jgi:hypothetical protein